SISLRAVSCRYRPTTSAFRSLTSSWSAMGWTTRNVIATCRISASFPKTRKSKPLDVIALRGPRQARCRLAGAGQSNESAFPRHHTNPVKTQLSRHPKVVVEFVWMSQVLSDPQISVRSWQTIAGFIDHTLLKSEATAEQIVRLCEEAVCFNFAAV